MRGMTLLELMIATALSLMLMGPVVYMVGKVGDSVAASRSMLESADRLRLAEARLQMDLAGITCKVNPPADPSRNEGYFEYIEGPVGVVPGAFPVAVNTDNGGQPDNSVGDFDDILMFTTRSSGKPFIGRCASSPTGFIESKVAEVAWFVRGRTLYRRVLLVAPSVSLAVPAGQSYYQANDVSARLQGGVPVPNTLGTLTMRECRYAHPDVFPFDASRWGQLRLPTLRECSQPGWIVGQLPPASPPNPATADFWTADSTQRIEGGFLGNGSRLSDDIILTNVIGFDVKAWEPALSPPGYVDLGYNNVACIASNANTLSHTGNPLSRLVNRTYDIWSDTYFGVAFRDGLDTDGNGIVDDANEKQTLPPYSVSLRGVQVKIRVFEPDSKQVREVTVVQDFLP